MRRFKICINFFLAMILASACKKGADTISPGPGPGSGPGPTPVVNDSTQLWKYVKLDTTVVAGLDTSELMLFDYDSQKRMVFLSHSTRASSSPSPAYTTTYQNYFYYNGSDTTPYKIIALTNNSNMTRFDTVYYIYTSNGLVAYDSVRMRSVEPIYGTTLMVSAREFAVAGTIVNTSLRRTIIRQGGPPDICNMNSVYTQTYQNGNIITENQTFSGCSSGSATRTASYDNKLNPFYRMLLIRHPIVGVGYFGSNQKNNKVLEYLPETGQDIRYDYEYGTNNLPNVVRRVDLTGYNRPWKGLFYFRKP